MKANAPQTTRFAAIFLALIAAIAAPANAQITVGGNGANTTDSTSYSGTNSLTKVGSNTVTLSANSTYSGTTFVNGGTLRVNSSGANFTPNNPNTTYTVNSGATLSMGSGSTAALWGRSVTLNNGTLFNAVSDYNDALSSLTMSGGSVAGNAYRVYDENTWQLSGNNTINTWIGYVTFGAPTGHTFNVTNGRTVMGGHISDFFAGGGPQFLQKTGNGTLVLTGANSYAGETRIQAGTLQVGNGGAGGTLGSGSIVNNGTLALNRSDNTTLGNSISGTGGVVKQGIGDVTFSAANSFSGGLTVEQGIAWVSGQNNLGSGTITLGNANTGTGGRSDAILLVSGSASTTITNNVVASAAATAGSLSLGGIGTGNGNFNLWTGTINLGKDLNLRAENTTTRSTFAGQITGNGGITVSQGRITLENTNNNYAGGTTVNAGTILQLSGNEVLPNATDLTVNGSLTLASGGGTETVGRLSGTGGVSALLPGSYTMAIAHNGSATFGGTISNGAGTVSVIKSGAGTQTLAGNNTYTGGTTISAGTLRIGDGGTSGAVVGNITNNATLALNRTNDTIFGNNISGSGSVVKQGFGDVTFSGSNSYSGGLTVEQGIAWVSGQSNLGSGTITLGNANTGTGGRSDAVLLVSGSASTTITNNVVASAAATAGSLSLGGIGTGNSDVNLWTGTINLGKDLNLRAENTTTRSTFAGQITGNGGITVSQGRITLENTNNNYAGGTTVNAGTILQLSGNEVLPNATDLTVNGSLTLASGGGTETVGRLSGNGSVSALLPGSYTMAVAHNGSATFGGTISNGAGTVSVIKSGAGTQVLSGANTYTGGTTVNAGTLALGANNRLADSGAVTVNAGALDLGGFSDTVGAVTLAGGTITNGTLTGSSYDVRSGNASAVLAGSSALTKSTAGTVTLSGNNTYSGGTTISAGTLQVGNGGTTGTLGTGNVTNNAALVLNRANALSVSNTISGTGSVTQNGAGVTTLSASNTYTGGTTVNAGRLATSGNERLADSGAVTVNTNATFATGGDETIASLAGAGAVELGGRLTTGANNSTYSGSMSGLGGLTKSGAGTFTLSGASTYTGDTTLSGGTLVLDNANALWSGGVLSMDAGTTLTVNQRTFVGALDQGGGTVNGPGQLVATLTLTESGALNAVLADGPDFAAGILKRTAGTTTVGAANTFTGAVNVQGGTLQLGAGGSFDAASTLALSSGATMDLGNKAQTFSAVQGAGGTVAVGSGSLTVNNAQANAFGGSITGTGGVTKNGAGALTLNGTSTYSGATAVNAGTLVVDGSIDSSTVTVNSGATLSGSGSIGGLIVSSGGTINPGNSPGTQTVAGNATWNAGGNYNWQILDAAGSAGSGWDLLNIGGTLNLSALTVGNEFEINLWSLSSIGPDVSGNALNFDSAQNYTWTIASAASGITGFTGSNQFSINTSANNGAAGFANALNGGSFSIAQSGNDLNLVFTAAVVPPGPAAVPEPGTWAAAALLAGGAYLRWRKRRQAHGEEAKA